MCQLTYLKTENVSANILRALVRLVGHFNTSIGNNKDGWGIYNIDTRKLIKHHIEVDKDDTFSQAVYNYCTDSRLLMHVRAASNKDTVKTNNNHPFIKGNFTFMHNGTLTPKDSNVNFNGLIDSEFFADRLDDNINSGLTLIQALKATYSEFTGKFAFMIHEYSSDLVYIIRGKTATLFEFKIMIPFIENPGYIYAINTDRATFVDALYILSELLLSQGLIQSSITLDCKPVDENTINIVKQLDDNTYGLEKLDEMIQEATPEKVFVNNKNMPAIINYLEDTDVANSIGHFFGKWHLSSYECMILMQALTKVHFSNPYQGGLPTLKQVLCVIELLDKKFSAKDARYWKAIINRSKLDPSDIYKIYSLEFPYFLNDRSVLKDIANEFGKDKNELPPDC